jgi:hypothetical protein
MDLWVWVVICAAWLGFEVAAIRRNDDGIEPFTYYVRKALSLERGPFALGWWFALGLIGWLAWHFLIDGVFAS